MKQHLRYKHFIRKTEVVPIKKLIVYCLVLALAAIPQLGSNLNLFIIYSLLFILFVYLLPQFYLNYKIDFYKKSELKILCCLLLYLGLAMFVDYNNTDLLLQAPVPSVLVLKIMTLILVGFTEEYIFRGLLLKQLILHTKKIRLSIILCAILFTLIHIPRYATISTDLSETLSQLLSVFVIGLLFADIYFISNSLVFVSLLHSAMDAKLVLFEDYNLEIAFDYFVLLLILFLPIIYRLLQSKRIISYH